MRVTPLGLKGGCERESMKKHAALWGLFTLAVCWGSASDAEPRKITQDEKNFCAESYQKFCGEYGLDSAALRACMDRNGRALPHNCIEALIDAGEVSRGEVERRKNSGR
jgi:hypothetical protein